MAHHEILEYQADERSKHVIRHTAWQAKLAAHEISDHIKVQNLQITVNAGVDAWGRPKTQPALLTVTLHLDKPFDSAAQADSLDSSTVHYGQLSKQIKSAVVDSDTHLETRGLTNLILESVLGTAGKTELRGLEIDIQYPKASLLGDAAGYLYGAYTPPHKSADEFALSKVLYLRNVRIPCIIGVNSNERKQKQPVVVNLWIDCVSPQRSDDYTKLEAVLVNVSSLPDAMVMVILIQDR
jgi:dihydroneopterin aldolase